MITMPSGSAAYSGNWPLFKAMGFLAPTIQTRRTSGNVLKKTTSTPKPSPAWSFNIQELEEGFTESEVFSQCENTQSGMDLDETLKPTSQLSFEEVETHGETDVSSGSSASGLRVIYPVPSTSRQQESEIPMGRKQQQLEAPFENPIPSTSRHPEPEISMRRRRQESEAPSETPSIKKRKVTQVASVIENMVKSCSDVGQTLNQFMRQSTEESV
ncbi:unnamed protein product [Ceutorhynchus assimilis]|uniref:Uncharacterized protein n=1 Tax=Ceutorhynchus assimilis TaxID=467358 RepID=A0A9N9MGV2_9CUCU|nr:unnamed protein product [Ceutorhynchus assimilis]